MFNSFDSVLGRSIIKRLEEMEFGNSKIARAL